MSQQRRLAAIMFTDIEGYTSLMHRDEKKGVELREKHRNIFKRITAKHNGTIIQYFGDGTLSIFKSSVDAVQCAINLQQAFSEKPKIPVRIGIHVGDIIYRNDDIIGDAVNIASRIESGAISGSILISDKVHDQIRSHSHIKATFLDAYEFKNVDDAIPLFAIANEGLAVPKPNEVKGKLKTNPAATTTVKSYKNIAKVLGIAILLIVTSLIYFQYIKKPKLLGEKSIAVLPFDNLSSDEDSEIFRDGMTEDILTHLAKVNGLHVISRTSVMRYKNTEKSVPEIAEELGVSYILEGSIRKYGDQVRVTAQLIQAANDEHIWAENYDKTLTDIFSIQTEVSKQIVDALQLNLSFEEEQQLAQIPTDNIEAYKLFLTGRKEADKRNRESISKSIELYKEAIELDSTYAEAFAEIANSVFLQTYYGGRSVEDATKLSTEYLEKAKKINENISRIYTVEGLINNHTRNFDQAQIAFKKAISLAPNDLTARHQYSTFFYYNRMYEKQLEQAKIAYSLDPLSFATANSYFTALTSNRRYDEAEKLMKKVEKMSDENNRLVINRSYFRLYSDQNKYEKMIPPLKEIVKTQNVFNRFLGYAYVKLGDTLSGYRIIDSIHKNAHPYEKSQQLAVVYSALKKTDSVLYYLDTIRNKQSRTFSREVNGYFAYLKEDPRFLKRMQEHGIDTPPQTIH